MKALWKNTVIAESNETIVVENNHYFPADSLVQEHFIESNTQTVCHWKGRANYYTVVIDDCENQDAAWYYPEPKEKAANIINHVAFWRGVRVVE